VNLSFLSSVNTNIYSLIISALIVIHEFNGAQQRNLQDKLFKDLLSLNVILVVLDSVACYLNGKAGVIAELLNYMINVIGYLVIPLPLLIWALYTDYLIFQSKKHTQKAKFYLSFPMVINALLVLLSLFKGLIFYIDDKNIYHRGPFFIFTAAACFFYIIYSFAIILFNKNKIGSEKIVPLLIYPLPMLVGAVLQNIYYGTSTIWIGSTISIMILYFSIQNSRLNTDYLTGLYNRRQLDNYLKDKILNDSAKSLFAGILIDLDDFKSINGMFGHQVGDEALLTAANLLRRCFHKNDLIVRYAGDEFVIIKDINKPEDLKIAVDKLNLLITNYNLKTNKPYRLKLSLGYDIYDYKSGMGSEEFIKHIDSLMYAEKSRKKKLINTPPSQNIWSETYLCR
jgi:diguanylate cyclase (GGDEF)-like protein